MPTQLATNPDDVHVGIEFEFGVKNRDTNRTNQNSDLIRSKEAIDGTGMWVQVPEHTGGEANLVGTVPLSRYEEAFDVLFTALDHTGLKILTKHVELCGNHVHVNVENECGPGLHLPTLYDTYLQSGYQRRMWDLTQRESRRDAEHCGNHGMRENTRTFTEALPYCGELFNTDGDSLNPAITPPTGDQYRVRWTQGRGNDFSPRPRLGSVEFRTWDSVKHRGVVRRRYEFLHELFAATINRTPTDAGPTDYLRVGFDPANPFLTMEEAQRLSATRGEVANRDVIASFINRYTR